MQIGRAKYMVLLNESTTECEWIKANDFTHTHKKETKNVCRIISDDRFFRCKIMWIRNEHMVKYQLLLFTIPQKCVPFLTTIFFYYVYGPVSTWTYAIYYSLNEKCCKMICRDKMVCLKQNFNGPKSIWLFLPFAAFFWLHHEFQINCHKNSVKLCVKTGKWAIIEIKC